VAFNLTISLLARRPLLIETMKNGGSRLPREINGEIRVGQNQFHYCIIFVVCMVGNCPLLVMGKVDGCGPSSPFARPDGRTIK
jgi:hypothetical protein